MVLDNSVCIGFLKNSSEAKQRRIIYLDLVKIVSAFMVVFYHMSSHMNLGVFVNSEYKISVCQILMCVCSASVPLFFMVNGALLLNKNYSTQTIYHKAAKIALLLFVWHFLKFPDWFFKTLIVLYLLYPIFIRIYNSQKKTYKYVLMAAVFCFPFLYNLGIIFLMRFFPNFEIGIFGKTISLETIPLRTGAFTMYSILYFFLGGILFKKKLPNVVSILLCIAGVLIIIWGIIVYSNYTKEIADAVNACFPTVGTLLLSVGCFNLFQNFEKIHFNEKLLKVIGFFGNGVLCIYIFHPVFINLIYGHILTKEQYGALIILPFALLILIACAVINAILSRIPLAKELVKI